MFFHHYTPPSSAVGVPIAALLREGHVGVTVFFVLSGFLIAWNYFEKSRDRGDGFWGEYLLKRFARIQPAYLALLAVQWLWSGTGRPDSTEVLLNVTLLKGFFDPFKFTGLPQAWSLTVEETFYLCAPFLFDAVRRWGLVAAQIAIWPVGLALAFGNPEFTILYTFLGRSLEFTAGIALALWMLRRPLPRLRHGLLTYTGLAGCWAATAGMAVLATPQDLGLLHPLGMALNNVVLPAFLVLLFAGLVGEDTVFARMLGGRALVFLGRASYAFYLVHYGAMPMWVFPRIAIPDWPLATTLIWFATANLAAAAVFVLIERPAHRALLRAFRPVPQRATMVA